MTASRGISNKIAAVRKERVWIGKMLSTGKTRTCFEPVLRKITSWDKMMGRSVCNIDCNVSRYSVASLANTVVFSVLCFKAPG